MFPEMGTPTVNPEATPTAPASTSRYWIPISAFWALITLAAALQEWLILRGEFWPAFRFAGSIWLPWSFLTPIIIWFTNTNTLDRSRWQKRLTRHLILCLVIAIPLGLISHWAGPPPRKNSQSQSSSKEDQPTIMEIILRRGIFQFPIYWSIVAIAHAFIFSQRAREREQVALHLETRLAKSRLQALQMQLNPHFLFNTLNSIASLVHENPKASDEMITSLSEFLRLTLKTSDRSEVPLREEMDFLDHYLAIEQIRFGDRLCVEKRVEPALLGAQVPVLILQPLVENAIKHGIEKKLGPGVVTITAQRNGEALHLQVQDNGRGLQTGSVGKISEGVGLSNIRARLRELAGDSAALQISSSPEGGFVAEIRLPWRTIPSRASQV